MKTLIVIGSTRSTRVGDQVAAVVRDVAESVRGVVPTVDDLRERGLPLLDEPLVPAAAAATGVAYAHAHTRAWSETVTHADAVVFVTPQYNGGYPAALKNAIDYLYAEWQGKPAMVVSYGVPSSGGGASVQEQLKTVAGVVGLALVDASPRIQIGFEMLNTQGRLDDPGAAATDALEELRLGFDQLLEATAAAPSAQAVRQPLARSRMDDGPFLSACSGEGAANQGCALRGPGAPCSTRGHHDKTTLTWLLNRTHVYAGTPLRAAT